MENKIIKTVKTITQPLSKGSVLPADELKRLTDFFTLLIQIDRRTRKEVKRYENKSVPQES